MYSIEITDYKVVSKVPFVVKITNTKDENLGVFFQSENGKEFEGITISRKLDAKYTNRIGFKIIDTIDCYSEKNEAKIFARALYIGNPENKMINARLLHRC